MNKEEAQIELERIKLASKFLKTEIMTHTVALELNESAERRLQVIIDGPKPELKKLDWLKVPDGTLVEVSNNKGVWLPRYFFRGEDGNFEVYSGGCTALTVCGGTTCFDKIRLIENPEFTYWPGGDCPLPEGVMVEVVVRDGDKITKKEAIVYLWTNTKSYHDIIAYRIVGVAEGWSAEA